MSFVESFIPHYPGPWAISLHRVEGPAKTFCNIFINEDRGGYTVTFQNGMRASALAGGTVTGQPVPYAQAREEALKLLHDKLSEGYRAIGAATPTVAAIDTGLRPMLSNSISLQEARSLIEAGSVAVQEKFDGERRMIRVRKGVAAGANRNGHAVALPKQMAAATAMFPDCVLDGEQVDDVLHVFDILEIGSFDLRRRSLRERLAVLSGMSSLIPRQPTSEPIRLVHTAVTVIEALELVTEIDRRQGEGIVVKSLDAAYVPGRPESGGPALTCDFVRTATAIVASHNGPHDIAIALETPAGLMVVGNVTVPANRRMPDLGERVEIRYRYVYRGGSLYKPVYLGAADDVAPNRAALDQLVYRAMLSE